jgi:hypothetical protein
MKNPIPPPDLWDRLEEPAEPGAWWLYDLAARKLLTVLRDAPEGITRTAMHNWTHDHMSGKYRKASVINRALESLAKYGLARMELKKAPTGHWVEYWYPTNAKQE